MHASFTSALLFVPLLLSSVSAMITPTSPDSTTVVPVGGTITAMWTEDVAGGWNNVTIQLMTGNNLQMVALETVATGIDGTTTSSYSFTAPNVSPYSEIYFLQFSNGGDMTNLTWTTRFTISGPNGETTTPSNTTVYSGVSVNWGTGELVSNSTTGTSNSAATTTAALAAAASSTSATASGVTIYTSGMSTSVRASSSVSVSKASTSVTVSASAKSSNAGINTVVPGLGLISLLGAGAIMLF